MRIVLLHGLARSIRSMRALGRTLEGAGHQVTAIGYPSRQRPLEALAREVADRLAALEMAGGGPEVGFVTVLVDETRTAAAADHVVVPGTHSFLPQNPEVQRQVLAFLADQATRILSTEWTWSRA